MKETVAVNGLTLCHKNSAGLVQATVPDVCKTPAGNSTPPIPYPNIAFARDLAKGTKTVKSHGGAMCGIKGSEFSRSTGDEPGTAKGVKSGTVTDRATFILWSPNVFAEGKNVTRLTDHMLMNDGNTVSMGGYYTGPVQNTANQDTMNAICDKACECLAEGTMNQRCVAGKMREWAAETGTDLHPEASYVRGPGGNWIPRGTRADGTLRTSRPAGSRVPDFTNRGTGSIIEVKLANPETSYHDRYGAGQQEAYERIAEDLDMDFEEVDFDDCECSDDGDDGEGEGAPVEEREPGFLPLIPRLFRWGPPIYIPPGLLRPPGQLGPPIIA